MTVIFRKTNSKTSDLTFLYKCTGMEDDTAIQGIINEFFAAGTAMAMKLIISGTMGLTAAPANNRHIDISAINERGAVCFLDFSDCDIPTALKTLFAITNSTARVNVTGLVATTTEAFCVYLGGANNNTFNDCTLVGYQGVNLNNASNNTFNDCIIESNLATGYGLQVINSSSGTFNDCTIASNFYGMFLATTFAGRVTFENCKIIGGITGMHVATAQTTAEIRLIGCAVKGTSTQDIQQIASASTIKWFIMGNSFSRATIIVDGTTAIAYKTASASIYFPQYANQFSREIT